MELSEDEWDDDEELDDEDQLPPSRSPLEPREAAPGFWRNTPTRRAPTEPNISANPGPISSVAWSATQRPNITPKAQAIPTIPGAKERRVHART